VTAEITPQGTVEYTYDSVGRRATMTVPGQALVTYTYDDADRLTGITQGASSVTLAYDAADRRTSLTLPNGSATTYEYNDADQFTTLRYWQGSIELGGLTYSYDLGGRRTSTGGTWARTGLPMSMSYATYDAANQLTNWAGRTRQYDGNGQLVSDGASSYSWGTRGRLVAISGATAANFAYDAIGRRISASSGGATSQYLYDGARIVSESRSTGTVAFLNGTGLDEWLTRTDSSGQVSFLVDGIGSRVGVVDSAGTLVGQSTYDPFGVTYTFGASEPQGGFTGREQEAYGLYYYRARYYDPTVGRFLSEDPAGGDASGNGYSYVEDDPTNANDPTGLRKVEVCCRGLIREIAGKKLFRFWKHCFIKIFNDGNPKPDTYAILGDQDSSKNQTPRMNDNLGPRGTDRNLEDNPKCQNVPGTECQIQKLINGLNAAVRAGTCPSCGENYQLFFLPELTPEPGRYGPVDGFNSNTWVYNMILGAGMTPPGMGRAPGYHQAAGAWYPQ